MSEEEVPQTDEKEVEPSDENNVKEIQDNATTDAVTNEQKVDDVEEQATKKISTEDIDSVSQAASDQPSVYSEQESEGMEETDKKQSLEDLGTGNHTPENPTDIIIEHGTDEDNINPPPQDSGSLSVKYDVESTAGPELEFEDMHPLDELTDQQVIDLVQEIEIENRHLYLENNLFESFLKDNDPSLMEGLEEMMNFLIGRSTSKDVERRTSNVDKNKYRLDSYTSITSIAEGKGPKINLSQKTDMVMRAMEESQTSLEAFLKKCHIIKRNLKSELEEFTIREAEIKEATDIFEYSVVTQGLDKLTQRIPAEKFIRYMEEWLKSAQLQIEKLRLRIATFKVQYKKVSQQLIQRQELGENVHAVDFDQLEIENKHFLEKIDQKNIHLIELKKMNGSANLILSTHKKFLQRQQEECNKIKNEIEEKKKQIEDTEKECIEAEEELGIEIDKYDNCKFLKSQYTVPDVMDYVRLKGKLHEIRKNIKVWVRRRKIQEIALNTCLREMKNLTGTTDIDHSWFDEIHSVTDGSLSEEMLF